MPTVLRIFGSKDQLFQLAFDELIGEMRRQLAAAGPGDVGAAVRTWFDHYETFGDAVVNSLAEEHEPAVAAIVRTGRVRHRERVETVLAPQLRRFTGDERTRRVSQRVIQLRTTSHAFMPNAP